MDEMSVCEHEFTGRKDKNLSEQGRRAFCAVLGQFKHHFRSEQHEFLFIPLKHHFVTWEQSERSSDCRTDTEHVLYHYPGHYSLLTAKNLWLRLQMKPVLLPALHRVPAACQVFVTAHKAAIVWLQLTRRKTSVLQYEWSAHDLSFSKLTKETFSPCRIKKYLQPSTQR